MSTHKSEYQFIVNPESGRTVNINGYIGRKVLANYLNPKRLSTGEGVAIKKSARKNSRRSGGGRKRSTKKRPLQNRKYNQNGGGGPALKIFYTDWCSYCKAAKPDFSLLKKDSGNDGLNINGQKVKVELINGDENSEEMAKYKVHGFPSIKLVKSNGSLEDYGGERTAVNIVNWMRNEL